jgi:hypothetical protein
MSVTRTGSPPISPTQIVELITRIAVANPGASPETLGAEAGEGDGRPVIR